MLNILVKNRARLTKIFNMLVCLLTIIEHRDRKIAWVHFVNKRLLTSFQMVLNRFYMEQMLFCTPKH